MNRLLMKDLMQNSPGDEHKVSNEGSNASILQAPIEGLVSNDDPLC